MQMQKQTTLAASISYSGNGLHSGKPVTMTLKPAAPDTGIVFIRTDLPDQPEIHAKAELVTSTLRATTISENGAQVFTVEHLLASLAMMHVDNCHIEMNSPEPPVADGSGLVFAQLVLKAGRKEQDAERKVYKVDRAFSVYDGDKYIVMLPYDGVRISFTSINPHPLLGTQYKDVELTEESFLKEIAPARTIGFMNEVEQMKKMGLGLGAIWKTPSSTTTRNACPYPGSRTNWSGTRFSMSWGTCSCWDPGRAMSSPSNRDMPIILN